MKYDIRNLRNLLQNPIETDVPMSRYTTFRTGGCADFLLQPFSVQELIAVLQELHAQNIPYFLLGRGSNVLVSDYGIEGAVILTGGIKGIETTGEIMRACCGTPLSDLASQAMRQGLSGLEFTAGIPGSVGGAVYMNAGAYGSEIKDMLLSAEVYRKGEGIITLSNSELKFAYRTSALQCSDDVILSADFCLQESSEAEISETMQTYLKNRKEKQPLEFPSAGSTFKRPPGYFAGKLIEDVGLKGFSIGGAQVSEKHAGFIINTGNATSMDIVRLIAYIRDTVERRFPVCLEPEVHFIGRLSRKKE